MKRTLETQLYEVPRFESRERVYRVGDLESLSAGVLYTPKIGSSNFRVFLPPSNSEDRSLKIITPESITIINRYQRIIGKSGVDYFNQDGSLAGRILGLNESEVKYLKSLNK